MPVTNALPDMMRELRFIPVVNAHPKKLRSAHIRQYNEKGYIFPLDVFTPEECVRNRVYFETLMEKAAAAGHNSYAINGWHRFCAGLYDLATEPRILDYAEDLLGPNLVCTMTHYFCKLPGDPSRVAWHQDASYWPLTPSRVVTVWLAIDDVDTDNGPMTAIPGSHLHGQIPFEHSRPEERSVLGQSVQDAARWGDAPEPFVMAAGQISMHSDLLLHGSEPNTSNRRRCGLTLRYMPPEVRGRDPERGEAILCRGEDPSGYWRPIPRLEGDTVPSRRG
jgi:hypothetical protein